MKTVYGEYKRNGGSRCHWVQGKLFLSMPLSGRLYLVGVQRQSFGVRHVPNKRWCETVFKLNPPISGNASML
jgi:hypothetical protein